jgi:hypothetical protein
MEVKLTILAHRFRASAGAIGRRFRASAQMMRLKPTFTAQQVHTESVRGGVEIWWTSGYRVLYNLTNKVIWREGHEGTTD